MHIYVAAHCRWAASYIASILRSSGHVVTSRWLDEPFHTTASYPDEERRRVAEMDRADVFASDLLVLVAGPDKYSGGKFVEAGIAIGLNKPVVVLGRRENMLLYVSNVKVVDTPEELIRVLE